MERLASCYLDKMVSNTHWSLASLRRQVAHTHTHWSLASLRRQVAHTYTHWSLAAIGDR